MKHPLSFGPVLLAAGAIAWFPAAHAATQIGVTSAVIPAARGTPPEAEARVLQVGLDMQANERVQTDADGKAQLLFLDGSALSIRPNSDVMLDEYVYDPISRTGKIALSATRGVFRLVGGAISKTTPVQLRTPTATIGVRGGIAMASVGQTTSAAFLFGSEMTVAGSGGSTQTANRPGFEITTNPNGTVNPPLPLSERTLAGLSAMEGGGGGQGQGGGPAVSDSDVSDSQVSSLNSATSLADAAPASGGADPGAGATPPLGEVAQASQQQMLNQSAMGGDGGSPPSNGGGSPIGPIGPGGDEGSESPTPGLTLPFTFVGRAKHASTPSAGTDDVSPTGNVGLLGQPGVVDGVFSASASSGGNLTINVEDGAFLATSTQQPFGAGTLTGAGYLSDAQDFLLYQLAGVGDGRRVLAFAGVPTPTPAFPTTGIWSYVLLNDFVREQTLPFIVDPGVGSLMATNAYIAWDDSTPVSRRAFGASAVAILGQGPTQRSAFSAFFGNVDDDASGRPFINGRMRGQTRFGSNAATDRIQFFRSAFASSDASDGSDFFGLAGPENFVLESAQVDNVDAVSARGAESFAIGQATQVFYPNNPAILGAPVAAPSRTTRTLNGFANALDLMYDLAGNFVGTQRLGTTGNPNDLTIMTNAGFNSVRAEFTLSASVDGSTVGAILGSFGGLNSAFIDDDRFVAATDIVIVSAQSVLGELTMITNAGLQHDGFLPAGVSFCDCDYLTWGFLAGLRFLSAVTMTERHIELGTWVAGELSNVNQLVGIAPQTATYAGHVMAGVNNNGAIYQAVGAMSLNFTFGAGAFALNSVNITNFDGTNLAGVNSAGPQFGTNAYNSGAFTIGGMHPTAGNITASVKGAFFGPGAPPLDTGGSVDFNGTAYTGHGTFAATQPPS